MKLFTKIILLYLFSLSIDQTKAQSYSFSQRNEPYEELADAEVLTDPIIPWINEFWSVPLDFNFNYWGYNFDEVSIYCATSIYFSSVEIPEGLLFAGYSQAVVDRALPNDADFTETPVSYKKEGTSPDQIFKVQYKNLGFLGTDGTDSANVQIWLFENGKIEVHMGATYTSGPEAFAQVNATGPVIGMINEITENYNILYDSLQNLLYGQPIPNFTGLSIDIPSGTVFEFTPNPTSTVVKRLSNITSVVDKINGLIYVNGVENPSRFMISDISGRMIQTGMLNQNNNIITVNTEQKGIYFFSVFNDHSTLHSVKFFR
jgi:hypothetical protein